MLMKYKASNCTRTRGVRLAVMLLALVSLGNPHITFFGKSCVLVGGSAKNAVYVPGRKTHGRF
jgi:hypothetical protein